MNQLIWIAVVIVFVFLLTYDPKSGKLETYINPKKEKYTTEPIKNVSPFEPPIPCVEDRYFELQFNVKAPPGECAGHPIEYLGAVIQA